VHRIGGCRRQYRRELVIGSSTRHRWGVGRNNVRVLGQLRPQGRYIREALRRQVARGGGCAAAGCRAFSAGLCRGKESVDEPIRRMRLTYLTLQATSEGQAAHAHVHEIVSNLKKLGWEVTVVGPGDAAGIDVSLDRKSTRMDSSHLKISYVDCCL